jgi:hypothetical protein
MAGHGGLQAKQTARVAVKTQRIVAERVRATPETGDTDTPVGTPDLLAVET